MAQQRLTDRLLRYASIAGFALLMIGWVFSALVAAYGLIYEGGNDAFYNKSPWGMIAFPGYFLLLGAGFGIIWGAGALGWRLILMLSNLGRRADWGRYTSVVAAGSAATPESRRQSIVLSTTAWATGVVGALLLLWGDPFLPTGIVRLPIIAALTIVSGVVILGLWKSWQRAPRRLGRVVAGVAAGVLMAIAYGEATRSFHSECVSGVGGRDPECFEYEQVEGPAMANAAFALLGAGVLVYFAASLELDE